ncbi:S-layer homology domain-containing protein [Paenibacillus albidus]|uniref:S-layer homology domain-containing protein n=1 Tax=Paenibacillus albidus TaxID=2041023 RepID=UPI001BEC1FF4|nr:S-layer homology domain-containing protein [Paenibacillus albidus]MBT2290584.1 S-layer homology domain-containing protein [Paenibacillus albidus]
MTLKKKLAVSTLAVSMAAATVAGIPLSGKGLAQQLGFTGTASAASISNADVKAKVAKLYNALTDAEKQALLKYQTEAGSISQAKYEAIFKPILDKLKLSGPDVQTSHKLFTSVSSVVYDVYAVDNDFAKLKEIRYNPDNIALLKGIAAKAGIANLTVDDLIDFLLGTGGVEAELRALISSKTTAELLEIVSNPNGQEALLNEAIDKVMDNRIGTDGAATVSQVVYNLGITKADVKKTLTNLNTEITSAKPAAKALATAYIRAFGLGVNPGTGGSGGGGGGGGVVTTPVTNPTATPGIYDVSKLVFIVGDKATLKLVDADVIKAFDALVAANPGKTGLTLTLNLGTVNAKTVEVPLSKVIIEAAKARGIANIAITFNGLTVTIPVGQFSDAVTLTVSTLDDSTITNVSKQKLASSVYDFKVTVGGVVVTVFKQPITIKLPLKNTTDLDKELLSVGKLVYNKLDFQGGVVDGEYIIEPRDTFSTYAVLENKVSFNDISKVQAWAGRQIQVVAAKGAIEGIGDSKFAPKSNVTRAEFAKMLIRALNLENNSAAQTFTDVSSTAWYAPYVAVAAEKGIITGRGNSKFDPSATITRAEMATMISRALKAEKGLTETAPASALNGFKDASKIAASLKEGVAFAASHNLVIGNAGKFNPNDTATRAEAAVIIYRTINFK